MEDYFVIILTLVIAVVGALSRKKKKKAANVPVEGGVDQPSSFWDAIMNQQGEFNEETVTEYIEPESVVEKYDVPVEKQKYSYTAANEGKSIVSNTTKMKSNSKRKVMIDGEEFSLKKAVIYSEIMNRKYS